MEAARDMAERMRDEGEGVILDQFANPDNPLAHYRGTGPEIWRDTQGKLTHFVSTMGTTGTIMGCSRFLKERNPAIAIVGVQPAPGAPDSGHPQVARGLPAEDLRPARASTAWSNVAQAEARRCARRLAREEGIFAGISSGGALRVRSRSPASCSDAMIVLIVCDRGDRYLSTGVFPA